MDLTGRKNKAERWEWYENYIKKKEIILLFFGEVEAQTMSNYERDLTIVKWI